MSYHDFRDKTPDTYDDASSTRNTRIERLWVEVGTQFARCWCAFFSRLERLHSLDVGNESHLWLLHSLFLDNINKDCKNFQDDWNAHPISGPSMNDKSPQVSKSTLSAGENTN